MRTIVEESTKNLLVLDVFSKLIQERIIFIDEPIDAELANGVIAQLMHLNSISSTEEITIYINTPGGSVAQGLAIYDVAKLLPAPIKTIGIGEVASMGAILMLIGNKRCGLKHTRFMLHQISLGAMGSLSDVQITIKEGEYLQTKLYDILREKTNIENIEETFKQDIWMSSEECLKNGVLTEII